MDRFATSGKLSATLNVDNMTDKNYSEGGASLSPPRSYTFSLGMQFGRGEWLRPYTDQTVEALAKRGVQSLAMVAPGFSADCLETLEELDVENREIFEHNGKNAGGQDGSAQKFSYIPCLNDSAGGLRVIESVVRRELMGWV